MLSKVKRACLQMVAIKVLEYYFLIVQTKVFKVLLDLDSVCFFKLIIFKYKYFKSSFFIT
jgi:hypothetical protein